MIANKKQSLSGHFGELKKRLFYILFFFFLSFTICYYFVEDIYNFLLVPLNEIWSNADKKLIYTDLTEFFFSYLRLSYYGAVFLTLPFLACQIYIFIAPGLYKKEKKAIFPFLITSPILFFLGAVFVYYFIFPLAWKFFLSFEQNYQNILPIRLEAKVSEYLNIVVNMIIAFGIAFQLPIILVLLAKIDLITVEQLKRTRKLAIVFIFIVAAILTPPDVISQIGLAIVMLLLYELSIIIVKRYSRKN